MPNSSDSKVTVLCFGAIGEKAKDCFDKSELSLDISASETIESLIEKFASYENSSDLIDEIGKANTLFAVNQEMVSRTAPVITGDEVAIMSPLSGG